MHFLLAELHVAVAQGEVVTQAGLLAQVGEFAAVHHMPFYQRLAERVASFNLPF